MNSLKLQENYGEGVDNNCHQSGYSTGLADSTNLRFGTNDNVDDGTLICYTWKAVSGVSAFGSYTGTGGANTITYTGSNTFTASWIMVKRFSDDGENWVILDKFRDGVGEFTSGLYANTDDAEVPNANFGITPTSTGFTMDAGTTASYVNTTGTYIYIAFA